MKKTRWIFALSAIILTIGLLGCGSDDPANTTNAQNHEGHDHAMHNHAEVNAGEYVNAKCPIMGSKINTENVNSALTREFNGQKVAFCCAGCPETWDTLSEEEKKQKLEQVKK
jgi:hypothetical protein